MNEAFERLPEAGKMAVLAAIALVFAGALLWAVGAAGRRRARQLDALARALGMERVVPGQPGHRPECVELRRAGPGPRASVVFRGGVRDASGQRDEWTELETQLKPPLGVGLALRRDDALTQLEGWFKSEDLRVGEATFDATFAVRAQDARGALALLEGAAPREALLALQGLAVQVRVEDHRVVAVLQNEVLDAERLRAVLEAQARVARALGRGA